MKLNKRINFFLLFIILLLFIKTDYRLETGIYCCKDDHEYYAHAETLVIDLDFDYSNQFVGNEEQRFYYTEKQLLQHLLELDSFQHHFYLLEI